VSQDSSAAQWHGNLRHLDGQVLGLALVRPLWLADPMTHLSPQQKVLRKYWLSTKYGSLPLFFLDLVAVERLAQPITVSGIRAGRNQSNMIFQTSVFSSQNLRQCRAPNGSTMDQVLAAWDIQWPQVRALPRPVNICLSMPAAHALLCASGTWPSYGIPLTLGTTWQAGTGIRLVSNILPVDLPAINADAVVVDDVALGANTLEELRNPRHVYQVSSSPHPGFEFKVSLDFCSNNVMCIRFPNWKT
jgi:hypothetical protein